MTVYYRWHPLFGLSLPVHKRRRNRYGERVSCQLPDGRLCSIPNWMLRPECAQFSFGSPLISVEALYELRDVLTALQPPASCGKALLKSPAKEGGDETTSEATQPTTDASATSPCTRDGSSWPQANGTGTDTHGDLNQRSVPKGSRSTRQWRGR